MKEWEEHAALLSLHNNRKFVRLTPRGLPQPVIQRFDCTRNNGSATDSVVLLALLAALLAGLILS